MGKKIFPADVIQLAQEVLQGWTQIGSAVAFSTLTSVLLTTDISVHTPGDDFVQYEHVGGTRMSERKPC